jgi:hypothetical protein
LALVEDECSDKYRKDALVTVHSFASCAYRSDWKDHGVNVTNFMCSLLGPQQETKQLHTHLFIYLFIYLFTNFKTISSYVSKNVIIYFTVELAPFVLRVTQ